MGCMDGAEGLIAKGASFHGGSKQSKDPLHLYPGGGSKKLLHPTGIRIDPPGCSQRWALSPVPISTSRLKMVGHFLTKDATQKRALRLGVTHALAASMPKRVAVMEGVSKQRERKTV